MVWNYKIDLDLRKKAMEKKGLVVMMMRWEENELRREEISEKISLRRILKYDNGLLKVVVSAAVQDFLRCKKKLL